MIRLIATDIDGTLLPTGSMHPDEALRDCMERLTQLGIAPEETIVFGDAMNDIPLFSVTENSYAVSSAPAQVRQQAKHTVAPPEEQGVRKMLEFLASNEG